MAFIIQKLKAIFKTKDIPTEKDMSNTTLDTLINAIKGSDLMPPTLLVHSDVQRNFKWPKFRSNNFLRNILTKECTLDPIYIAISKSDGREIVVDGQHRLTLLYNFAINGLKVQLSDEDFIVTPRPPNNEISFNDLLPTQKTDFLKMNIPVKYYQGLTDKQVAERFFRLHDSMAATPSDDIRVIRHNYPIAMFCYNLALKLDNHYKNKLNTEHIEHKSIININNYYNQGDEKTIRSWLFKWQGGPYKNQVKTFQDIMDHLVRIVYYIVRGRKAKKEDISVSKLDEDGKSWFDVNYIDQGKLPNIDELFQFIVSWIDTNDPDKTEVKITLPIFFEGITQFRKDPSQDENRCCGIKKDKTRCRFKASYFHVKTGDGYCKRHYKPK